MSDYVMNKSLRYPITVEELKVINPKAESVYDIEGCLPELFNHARYPHFEPGDTEEMYLDYVLESTYGEECGDWGKSRDLTTTEKARYGPFFKKIVPDIDMNKVRLVQYSYYNCCEAPDYYDITHDDFYNEV